MHMTSSEYQQLLAKIDKIAEQIESKFQRLDDEMLPRREYVQALCRFNHPRTSGVLVRKQLLPKQTDRLCVLRRHVPDRIKEELCGASIQSREECSVKCLKQCAHECIERLERRFIRGISNIF